MNKVITFKDNSQVFITDKGNTYIGNTAHKFMYKYWELCYKLEGRVDDNKIMEGLIEILQDKLQTTQ